MTAVEVCFDKAYDFLHDVRALMKLLFAVALLSHVSLAAAEPSKTNAARESVAPTKLEGRGAKPRKLISSDLNGRELQFITSALDVRSTLVFLAQQTDDISNPNLRKLGEEIEKTLPSQTAVLSTLAEMRNVSAPEDSPRRKAIAKKLHGLKGARFEKGLLDALLDANQELVTTCEAGLRSSDKSVQQFAEQTLPYARGTLARVQAMAGITPRRVVETSAEAKPASSSSSAPRPGFRTNIPSASPGE